MIDINIYESQTCKTVSFGRKGENLARRIMFDLSALIAEFGAGSFEWVIRRPHESTVYIAVNKEQDGNTAILNLTATETAISGYGGLELRYYVDDVIVKTIVWRTSIAASLGTNEVPDPIEDYIDQMREIANEASESADAAGDSATQAAASAANAANSATEAAGYASNAAASASASADSATDSAASASAAHTSETNAANSATAAAGSASNASTSAANAATSSTNAASSATQAAGSATAAATSAAQAAASATAADESAQDIASSAAQIETNRTDIADLKNDLSASFIKEQIVKSSSDATFNIVYLKDGTTTTNSAYKTTDFIDCTKYSYIEYSLSGSTTTTPNMAMVSFFDSEKAFLTCVPAVINNGKVVSSTPVPASASYVRVLCRQGVSYEISATGVLKDSLNEKIDGVKSSIEYGLDGYNLQPEFDDPICYNSDGTIYSGGTSEPYRRMSRKIVCNQYERIKYRLNGITGKWVIVFFDSELNALSGVAGKGTNTYSEGIVDVPTNAMYISGSWLSSKTDNIYMIAESGTSVDIRLSNIEALTNTATPVSETEIVTPNMSVAQFIEAFNAARADYAALCLCTVGSFRILTGLNTFEQIYDRVNKNFRREIYVPGITHEMFCARVNHAFTEPIRRFQDIKLNNTIPFDFSVKFTEKSGEPSLYVSPDGSTLYVYGYTKRYATTDGMTWGTPENVVRSDGRSIGHAGFSVVGDTIFLVARDYTQNSNNDLVMYTSPLTDGLNFTFRGVPLPIGHDFGDGLHIDNWGNSFMIKDNGIYYLFIEGRQNVDGNFWDIYLVTCTDPFIDNGDGTIGNWQNCGVAPVIQARSQFDTSGSIAFGNPDIARGMDNRPIRIDGKWYMYFHSTASNYSYILRACSDDLVHWTPEFRLFDNRNRPTDGENQSSNADHSLIEFKGRTYFFYTTDINTTLDPHLAYMIDDRPFREILAMRP